MVAENTSSSLSQAERYERQLAGFRKRQRALAAAATTVSELIEEPNVLAIGRLMEILGEEPVREIAATARARFDAARAAGASAYQPSPNGTDVATYKGVPRSCGGVFFYLIRAHVAASGLNWDGLYIPSMPRIPASPAAREPNLAGNRPASETGKPDEPPRRTTQVDTAGTSAKASRPDNTAKSPSTAGQAGAKPNRLKTTVVGAPVGAAKQTDKPGVLQLVFDVEMSTDVPKGLPSLGRSRVIVLCTEKQYRQVASADATPGRMIAEGEAAATLSAAGKPLLVLVCTRLTTVEAEQAKHKRSAGSQAG